jgi:hypothetical protein
MKLLIGCEFSDIIGREFRAKGHDVTSCDLRPSEGSPKHYQGDIRDMLREKWDGIIACSPCTRKALAGVRWLHERNLWDDLRAECDLFNLIGAANCPRIARELPAKILNPTAMRWNLLGDMIKKFGRLNSAIVSKKQFVFGLKGFRRLSRSIPCRNRNALRRFGVWGQARIGKKNAAGSFLE